VSKLKGAALAVVAVLFAIGVATAIDSEGQLDKVRSCLRDASLRVERDDVLVRGVRGSRTAIPALDVEGMSPAGHVADVVFYSDDFEAEKARSGFEAGGSVVEHLENVLIVKDDPAPAGVESVRGCVKQALPAD
jgi:hypothetical protein